MRLSAQTLEDLTRITGFRHEDTDYNDIDLAEIVEDLIEEILHLNEKIDDIEEDIAYNYKYIGGYEY